MKKLFLSLFVMLILGAPKNLLVAQTQSPGLDILGYGYNVFGEYADQKSKKRYCLFKYSNFSSTPIGSKSYDVPQYVYLENISNHIVKTVSGQSVREYAKSLSKEVGLGVDAMFFSASINSSYNQSSSGKEQRFYYTYMDANTKWRISFDERDYSMLKSILDPRFKKDLATMDAAKLFELYGTHYIASAYIGGRADYTSVSTISTSTKTSDISLAVEAKYRAVSANTKIESKHSSTLSKSKTQTKLTVTGGNSQYANNISNPETYRLWADGIESMPVLCDFDKNSLKPIWDFCENTKRKAELKAEFDRMCKANPLPKAMASSMGFQDRIFYVKSEATGTYWDMPGYHFYAKKKSGKVELHEKDVNKEGWQGADRFIKIIAHTTKPEYVFFQPQHSDYVVDITGGSKNTGATLQLWNKGESNVAQMFKMLPVDGKKNTYYILNANSGLYLTAHANKKVITQEVKSKGGNQQWVFEPANAKNEMAPPPTEIYSFQNVKGKRFIDVPGGAPNQQCKGAKLQLWDMDHQPDRYMMLRNTTDKNFFTIQPLHSKEWLDVQGGSKNNGAKLQLWDPNNSSAQMFKFVYAGSPMTYYIINRNSGKAIDASDGKINQNGCPIQQWDFNGQDQQKWKLRFVTKWQKPPKNQRFYIKCAYTNKYWDLPGTGGATNQNGKGFALWDLDNGGDRKVRILPSGDHSWVNIEVQNGGRWVSVPGNSKENRKQIVLWDKNNSPAKKFAIMFTSPSTFVLRTHNWKAIDAEGGPANYRKNGARLIQWDPSYKANQQFQLIYADGPKKGQVYKFL